MIYKEIYNDKRRNERLSFALQISLLDHEGETKDISANGVYFEVFTKKREIFFPGTIIAVQINLIITTAGMEGEGIKIMGNGVVVRNDNKGATVRGSRLGVAMKFNEKLSILVEEH